MTQAEPDICPICHSDLGHKINCPRGAAFTTKEAADKAMKAQANPRTVKQRILAQAAAERPCPSVSLDNVLSMRTGQSPNAFHAQTCICHGTGQVAKFPILRVECLGHDRNGWSHRDLSMRAHGCNICAGRTWVPVSGPEAVVAMLEAIHSLGLLAIIRKDSVILDKPNSDNDYCGENEGHGKGPLLEALVAALETAEVAQ